MHYLKANLLAYAFVACSTFGPAQAFLALNSHAPIQPKFQMNSGGGDFGGNFGGDGMGNGIEEIEFRVYPDGRVTETVRGVKGGNCQKLTESINKNLGKVVDSKPTEEMYEQPLVIDQTVTQKIGEGGTWDGSMGGESW